MQIRDIYSIPKFNKLDKVGKVIFIFSFFIPIAIVYTFLHLYFLPFGLNQNYTLESKEVQFTNTNFFYQIDGEEVLDGIAEITIDTTIPKRNLLVTIAVEGEGSYITQHKILDKDIMFNPEFQAEFNEDFEYALIDDYKVKDEDFLVFKIDYDVNWETQENNELLLKYKNMRIIQHHNSVEFRIDKRIEGELKTYQTHFQFFSEDQNSPISLYAIYKKANETNGFLEIVAKNRISNRTVIPSLEKEYDDKIEIFETETVWHPQLIQDLSQEFISLKQGEYTYDLLQRIPLEFKDLVNPYSYYEKLYKPEGFDDEEVEELVVEIENGNEEEVSEMQEVETETVSLIGDGYFRYEEDDPNKRYQVFYKKDFFNDFQGEISKVSVAYEYPIIQKKELKTIFPNTPISVKIVGENSRVDELKINLQRESIWTKF